MSISDKAWRLIAESKINIAIEQGEFDHLPGFGQPLDEDYFSGGEHWWLQAKAKREQLSVLPPAWELKRLVQDKLRGLHSLVCECELRRELERLNERIRQANRRILWGPPSEVMPIDVERFVGAWRLHQPSCLDGGR